MALNIYEKGFSFPNTLLDCKKLKIWNILCLQASNLAPKIGRQRPAWQLTRSSSRVAGRVIVVLFWTKYAVPRQIKPWNLKLTIKRGVFTDQPIFSFNLSRIQISTGTSETNCNHKNERDMFTWGRIVLSLPKRAHVDWNWPISREKYLKIDWSVKNAVALAYCGSCRLQAMSSWTATHTAGAAAICRVSEFMK